MIWIILGIVAVYIVIVGLCVVVWQLSGVLDNRDDPGWSNSSWVETFNDEHDSTSQTKSHTYRITSDPEQEQSWLSGIAQTHELDYFSVLMFNKKSHVEVQVRVRGDGAEDYIAELPGCAREISRESYE